MQLWPSICTTSLPTDSARLCTRVVHRKTTYSGQKPTVVGIALDTLATYWWSTMINAWASVITDSYSNMPLLVSVPQLAAPMGGSMPRPRSCNTSNPRNMDRPTMPRGLRYAGLLGSTISSRWDSHEMAMDPCPHCGEHLGIIGSDFSAKGRYSTWRLWPTRSKWSTRKWLAAHLNWSLL